MIEQEVLQKSIMCSGLSDEQLSAVREILSAHAQVKTAQANELLYRVGEKMRYIYLLEEGMARTVNYTESGEEIFFYYFSEGAFIGLVNIIVGARCTSDYMTMKKCRMYAIPVEDFHRALDELPFFTKNVLSEVSRRSLELVQLTVISRRKKTRDRLASYLYLQYAETKNASYEIPFTIEMLAKRLNLTRSALSKELHAMEREGLLTVSKNKIHLLDPESLEDNLFRD